MTQRRLAERVGSKSVRMPTIMNEILRFAQFFQANCGIVSQNRPRSLPPHLSIPIIRNVESRS
jgi:hypothetical protein